MQIDDFLFNADLETILDELRKQLSINNIPLLQKAPRRTGNGKKESLQIQCPYHGNGLERKPSAGIRVTDGMFHCFACNEVHTLPEFISHCFGREDLGVFGWQWLMKNFGTVQKEERKDLDLDFYRGRQVLGEFVKPDYVSEEELDSYRWTHPYWAERGITDEKIIELFDLGYDKATQCITFPIRDINGNCLFVARRSVNSKFFNYPSGAEKPVYGLYELNQLEDFPNTVIVCESMLDALTCWEYGDYAVALNGLGNGLQFKQLRDMPCRELVLATDNDEAGQNARARIRKNVRNKIIKEIVIPDGKKDINELTNAEYKRARIIF